VSELTTLNRTTSLPLILSWNAASQPLPLRRVRKPPRSRQRVTDLEAPYWLSTGPSDQPFDFCGHIRRLTTDIVRHCDDLRHIDVSRLLFAMTQARSGRAHGLQARVTPLRFRNGQLTRRRHGTTYQVQRYFVDGREMLYLVTFCLPRFLNLNFNDKFITLFHELYHIGPAFDGDLRRHEGRYALHSHSKCRYDAHMAQLARTYLNNGADQPLYSFMKLDFAQLEHRHGSVVGVVVPRPRLLPIIETR
jgi:predicted metallopeptidase